MSLLFRLIRILSLVLATHLSSLQSRAIQAQQARLINSYGPRADAPTGSSAWRRRRRCRRDRRLS